MREIRELIIHCSATPPTMDIGAAEIRSWHKAKGWADIGYHFVIRRDGRTENGRPVEKQGAHAAAGDHNKYSIGICMVGGTDKGGAGAKAQNNFIDDQWLTLELVVKNLLVKYPQATVLGHRDVEKGKECPSFSVRDWCVREGLPARIWK